MKSSLKLFLLCCGGLLWAHAAATPAPRAETLTLFENRKVVVAVPEGFACTVNQGDAGIYQVVLSDANKRVSMDIVFLPDPEEQFNQARARREMVAEQFGEYVDSSSEKGMQFEELQPRIGAGTYCVFTDAKLVGKPELPPGEYLHVTAGLKAWPGVFALFRLFSNDTSSAEYQAAMNLLRESVQEKLGPMK